MVARIFIFALVFAFFIFLIGYFYVYYYNYKLLKFKARVDRKIMLDKVELDKYKDEVKKEISRKRRKRNKNS